MPGIINSRIGQLNGSEIVRVEFDSGQTSLPKLVEALKNQSSFDSLIVKNEAERDHARKILNSSQITIVSSDPQYLESKYSLKTIHRELYYLDLTERQAIVLNSWSYFGGSMPDVLSTTQKEILPQLKERLSQKPPGKLIPARTGDGLSAYRTQLYRWLQE